MTSDLARPGILIAETSYVVAAHAGPAGGLVPFPDLDGLSIQPEQTIVHYDGTLTSDSLTLV